jgi:hypothetical protein
MKTKNITTLQWFAAIFGFGLMCPRFLTGNFDPGFGIQRLGDYSAVTLDPSNEATAWLVNEKINSSSIWGSRIITIGF